MKSRIFTFILFIVVSSAGLAETQQWYQQYERGLAAAEAGSWQEALDLFREASLRKPEPRRRVRTYGNRFLFDYDPAYQRARCLVELDRPEEALVQLERSAKAGVTAIEQISALRQRIDRALEPPPPTPIPTPTPGEVVAKASLTITSEPSAALLLMDGREIGRTPVRGLELSPRRHALRLDLQGFEAWRRVIRPKPGEHLDREVKLVPLLAVMEAQPEEESSVPEPAPRSAEPAPALGLENQLEKRAASTTESTLAPDGQDAISESAIEGEPLEAPGPSAFDEVSPAGESSDGLSATTILGALLIVALSLSLVLSSRRRRTPVGGTVRSGSGWRHLPATIGRYELDEEIGRGGMATTWRARRSDDGLEVALKIPHETGDPLYAERFLREGELGEALHHPLIVRIDEAGESDGIPYLAMELLPGRTLRELMDDDRERPDFDRSLDIVRDVAEALDYAHNKGVVHRDLKPENIMILPDGTVKVMDFGVARIEGLPGLTTSKVFFGSPLYASPESLLDPRRIDQRTDLYSLGILLFELLEGHPPFVDESVYRVLEMHKATPLPPLERLAGEHRTKVLPVLERLCAKEREERYGSAQELLVEIKKLRSGVSS